MTTTPASIDLSGAIAILTEAWGRPQVVRGSAQTMTALFQGLTGTIEELFERASAQLDFFSMAPQRTGGPPDMGIVTGRVGGAVGFIAKVIPSATDKLSDIDIKMEMLPYGADADGTSLAIFEAIDEILGERLMEEGAFARYLSHLLNRSGRHRQRFYHELALLVADYVQDPDNAP